MLTLSVNVHYDQTKGNEVIIQLFCVWYCYMQMLCDFQSILKLVDKVLNKLKIVRFILSHNPFPVGW